MMSLTADFACITAGDTYLKGFNIQRFSLIVTIDITVAVVLPNRNCDADVKWTPR